jgi:hypothetical protein
MHRLIKKTLFYTNPTNSLFFLSGMEGIEQDALLANICTGIAFSAKCNYIAGKIAIGIVFCFAI